MVPGPPRESSFVADYVRFEVYIPRYYRDPQLNATRSVDPEKIQEFIEPDFRKLVS